MDLPRLLQGIGHRAAAPYILETCQALAEEHDLYAVDVANKGDCALLALCASLGLGPGCHVLLREAAVRRVAVKWEADPAGFGAQAALSLQGPNAPLLENVEEYLAAALQPGFFLCEAELAELADMFAIDLGIIRVDGNGSPPGLHLLQNHVEGPSRPSVRLLHASGNHYMALTSTDANGQPRPQWAVAPGELLLRLMCGAAAPLTNIHVQAGATSGCTSPAIKANRPLWSKSGWSRARVGRTCSHPVAPTWWKVVRHAAGGGFGYISIHGCRTLRTSPSSSAARKTARHRRAEARLSAQDASAKKRAMQRLKDAADWAQIRWGQRLRSSELAAGQSSAQQQPAAGRDGARRNALRRMLAGLEGRRGVSCANAARYISQPALSHLGAPATFQRKVLTLAEIRTLLSIGCVESNPGPVKEASPSTQRVCRYYRHDIVLQNVSCSTLTTFLLSAGELYLTISREV
jgi:hypothetical protein